MEENELGTAGDSQKSQNEGAGNLSDTELKNITGGYGPLLCPQCHGRYFRQELVSGKWVCLDCRYQFD
jgi:acetyl-CoA carboxylase beta subunit